MPSENKVLSEIDVRNPKLNYGADVWRRPTIDETDKVIYDEPGRVLQSRLGKDTFVTYQSHYIVVVKHQYGGNSVYIKHGGGEERVSLSYYDDALESLAALSSDNRYLVLYMLYQAQKEASRNAEKQTEAKYRKAFVEGKLKKRKMPKQNAVKVWIENA